MGDHMVDATYTALEIGEGMVVLYPDEVMVFVTSCKHLSTAKLEQSLDLLKAQCNEAWRVLIS